MSKDGILIRRKGILLQAPLRPRVFIPQEPMRRDDQGGLVSVMNFAKATEYGDPIVLMPGGPIALSPVPVLQALQDKLSNYGDNDYIIAVGDPTVIAAAVMVACKVNNFKVNLLKWDKRANSYFIFPAQL